MTKTTSIGQAWWMVFLLCSLIIMSYIDRSVIGLMVEPVKDDLQISDKQIGLLLGAAFAFFYVLTTLLVSGFADRGNRKLLIIGGVTIWGFATLGSGLATSFIFLLICRALLAAGEATIGPSAASLIADLFTREKRVVPSVLTSLSASVGGVLSVIVGGKLVTDLTAASPLNWPIFGAIKPWQGVFVLVAIPTFFLLILFIITAVEPARRKENTKLKDREGAIKYIKSNKLLWSTYAGAFGLFAIGAFALVSWTPEIFQRYYDLSAEAAGVAFGAIGVLGGISGTILIPLVSQKLRKAGRLDSIVVVSLVLGIISVITVFFAVQQTNVPNFQLLLGTSFFCLSGALANLSVGLQIFVPARVMGTVSALILVCSAAVGNGIGPTITPFVADIWFGGEAGLSLALAAIIIVCSTLAAILLLLGRKEVYREVAQAIELDASNASVA